MAHPGAGIFWYNMCGVINSVQAAYEASEEEVSLAAVGRMYTIDFTMMQQINEETGNTRAVQRCTEQPQGTPLIVISHT